MNEVENTNAISNDLVVVGSSAGGIEALSILVSTLPLDFPAPIVLAQHLDPNRPSTLDQILQRHTSLPIEIVTTNTHLQPGKIYVVPANRHVSIKDHQVDLLEDSSKRPRPSVNLLLSSAAEAYGEHLIAVILTGSGSDGAIGAVEVKNANGTVIVQDPQTARYPSMPMALPPTAIDFSVRLEQIGPLLFDLLTGAMIPQKEERAEDVLREILELISHQTHTDFRSYRASTIFRRIGRRMTVTHNSSMRDYTEYLKDHPEEIGALVKAFLINVTQFFRDAEAFAYLKNEILPKLIDRARSRDKILRFWTAGCATGEEPYSLAMLLTDLLGAELPEWGIKIFATDLDEAVINFARRGIYSENLLKGLPIEYRDRFFERFDQEYRISKTLRQMVIFGQQNLSRSAPFPRIDLVLCRNVLIYFTPELQDYVLNQFAFSLNPDGYLFLGKAETVRPIQSFYELINKHWKVYRCIGNGLGTVRRKGLSDISNLRMEGRPMNPLNRNASKQRPDQESPPIANEVGQLRRFNELLLRFLPVGVIVINRAYHILTTNGVARRLLGLRDITTEQDFLHAVRGIPYHEIRNAIDTAFREHNIQTLPEIELDITEGGNGHFVAISIALMQVKSGTPELAVISVTDATDQVQIRRQLETIQVEQSELMNELSTSNKRLTDVNKELMDANDELQVSNEELMLTHEELQASIEEFETTNEELQATNEELETNNEELQATNEELETTNEELRTRTSELQEMTTVLAGERLCLTEMVELAPFYILVLRGLSLIVEAYNPNCARLLDTANVRGRPLEEVLDLFWEVNTGTELARLAREAYRLDETRITPRMLGYKPAKQEVDTDRSANYFTYTIVPSHNANGKVSGVLIYATDETRQRTREIEQERERLKLIFNNTYKAALALYEVSTTALLMGSPRYLEIVGQKQNTSPDNLIGQQWHNLTFAVAPEEATRLWNTVIETRTTLRIPEVYGKDKTETIWDYVLAPIVDPDDPNAIRYVLVSAIEVTEQVRARQELEKIDHLKEDFLSLVTHELRTPLTSILGNAQILQRTLKKFAGNSGNVQVQEQRLTQELTLLDRIGHQVRQMDNLIEEVLDVTRIRGKMFELSKQEEVNIITLARHIVEQYTDTES